MSNRLIKIFNSVFLSVFMLFNCLNSFASQNISIKENYRDSVIFIESKRVRKDGLGAPEVSTGTGFIISKNGHAMTASHVILESDQDHIVENTGSLGSRHGHKWHLELVKRDSVDVAIVMLPRIPNVKFKPLEFGDSNSVPEDAPLYSLGYSGSLRLSSASGILSSLFGPNGNWQTTLPLNRGDSGGPVFAMNGKVVGIAVAGNESLQLVTYVIPMAYIDGLKGFVKNISIPQNPNVLSNTPTISKDFEFYHSVDHQGKETREEQFCLPSGYKVKDVSHKIYTRNGDATRIMKIGPDPTNSSCIKIRAFVKGKGVKRIGPIIVDRKGRGWLGVKIKALGEKEK